ncbi:MarR family winged helix-turn-helix transcriptional regulator [Sphingobium nicotianae]|uniref:MarR family transcriptional regulator n=1 Tax=Sphingobium nicotianae TaxID=2782607 RepID=A0A9X1DD58_9SPHN|nr:MarR family transcriptional regulator [Sphingobium nicotianae]MBT2187746.1 MarR family transcriptional regulator [Sphingobium nicotianae]
MNQARSRTRHKRGPQAALPCEEGQREVRPVSPRDGRATPYGGYPTDLAERHLSNFYQEEQKPPAKDVTHFRTTRALVVAARRWRKLANDRIKSIGQNMARWETLYLLASSEEELSQSELAWVVGVKGPSMVAMLNGLAQDGLIERHQSNVDRRVTYNRITEKGREAARDVMAITNQLRDDVLGGIDPEKLAITLEVLEGIHARLDELR